jgi:cysteine desulfurase
MTKENINIYFDNNATTFISSRALSTIIEALQSVQGNPSSITKDGRFAKNLLIKAKKELAEVLNCNFEELTFTSGGTESIHTLIHGICPHRKGKILTTKIEHKSVLESIKKLNKDIVYIAVDEQGSPLPSFVSEAIDDSVAAIILSLVNGETGAVLAVKEIAELAFTHNIPLILDGVAALGRAPIELMRGLTAIAFSGHKCHGPKGTGFFYLKEKTPFHPLFKGGMQESGFRAGTENLPGILALVEAIKEINESSQTYMLTLRNTFEKKIKELFTEATINGGTNRVSNVSNVHFKDIDGDHLLIYLDQHHITASLGSACSSGTLEASHVLIGMGFSNQHARSSIRFSFSKMNTLQEIDKVCEILKEYKQMFVKSK